MHKTLLALALFAVAGPVAADAIAYTPNKAGGMIVLTSDRCAADWASLPTRRAAYVTNKTGNIITPGCWTYDNTHIIMRWRGLKQAVAYPISILHPVGEKL